MRAFILLIAAVYFVGVGVALAPTIRDKWNTAPASELAVSLSHELPYAATWPTRAYRSIRSEQPG
jgi:hypothetical protein